MASSKTMTCLCNVSRDIVFLEVLKTSLGARALASHQLTAANPSGR